MVNNNTLLRNNCLGSSDVARPLAHHLSHAISSSSSSAFPIQTKKWADDTIYDTVFQTTDGYALILRVTLPHHDQPSPRMVLHGVTARHPWIDSQMKVVNYPPISSDLRWKQSNMKLGDAVYAVIRHFQLNPREYERERERIDMR